MEVALRRLIWVFLVLSCAPREAVKPVGESPKPQFPFPPEGPWLRVGVGEGRSFSVKARDTLWLFVGDRGVEAFPPGTYRIRLRAYKKGNAAYYVYVKRFREKAQATEELFNLLEKGFEKAHIRVLGKRWGRADGREWAVMVGPFRSMREAKKQAPRPYAAIVKLYEVPPLGTVELLRGKRVLARSRGSMRLWSPTPLKLGKRFYPGFLEFVPWEGELVAVNVVQAEDYVAGVLPWEMGPEFPLEALKAQAVLARTHALWATGKKFKLLGAPYDLTDDQFTQIYKGVLENPKIQQAVEETRGMVLLVDGRLIRAPFHSSSGGYTETGEAVWGEPGPGTVAKPEGPGHVDSLEVKPFIDNPPPCWSDPEHVPPALKGLAKATFRWRVRRSKAAWGRVISRATGKSIGRLKALKVLERGPGGRAVVVEAVGTAGRVKIKGEYRIRQALGGLKSAFFYAVDLGNALEIRGGGFGHGAGLSQLGAAGMAWAGKNYVEILRNYFEGVQLVKLW